MTENEETQPSILIRYCFYPDKLSARLRERIRKHVEIENCEKCRIQISLIKKFMKERGESNERSGC